MASQRPVLLPMCRDTYGMKTFTFTCCPPSLPSTPATEYFVEVYDNRRLPNTRCFTLDYGEGITFAILPSPSVFPELEPVFEYLNSHPPNQRLEQASRNISVTTIYTLQEEMPADLHARTVQVMSQLQ